MVPLIIAIGMHHQSIIAKIMDTNMKILEELPTKLVVPVEADQIPARMLKAGMIVVGLITIVNGILHEFRIVGSMVINLRTKVTQQIRHAVCVNREASIYEKNKSVMSLQFLDK